MMIWVKRTVLVLCSLLLSFLLFRTTWAFHPFSFSSAELETLVNNGIASSEIKFENQAAIKTQLDALLNQTSQRDAVSAALKRRQTYSKMILEALKSKNLPLELEAIPFVETYFKNNQGGLKSNAGIWNTSPLTASLYGLALDEDTDQRTIPHLQTQAMINYLSDLNGMFHDWRLCIMAYYHGEGWVYNKLQTSSVGEMYEWEKDLPPEDHYLEKVAAAIVILKTDCIHWDSQNCHFY